MGRGTLRKTPPGRRDRRRGDRRGHAQERLDAENKTSEQATLNAAKQADTTTGLATTGTDATLIGLTAVLLATAGMTAWGPPAARPRATHATPPDTSLRRPAPFPSPHATRIRDW